MNFSRINYSNVGTKTLQYWKNANTSLNKRIKGTIFEKWVTYWKQIAKDYTEVTISVKKDMKEKPIKAAFYLTGIGVLGCCAASNPNLQSFRAKYVQCANDLALVNLSVANPDSMQHLKYIEKSFNANLIRYINLGIVSIVWVDNFSSECSTYESNCTYLKVPYTKFTNHILDVGFLNIWWVISRKMLDYDINY